VSSRDHADRMVVGMSRRPSVAVAHAARRLAPALAVALAAVVPAVQASATTSFHAIGVIRSVDASHGLLSVRDTDGDRSLRGHVLTVHVTSSTRITRDGHVARLSKLKAGDRVDASGNASAGRLVATKLGATSPPQPDGPAVGAGSVCIYYGPCTPTAPPSTSARTLTITITNFTFDPPTAVIPVGTLVTVRNADPVAHTFSGTHLDSGALRTGGSYTVEFTTPGLYRFYCAVHPFMNGVLDVR